MTMASKKTQLMRTSGIAGTSFNLLNNILGAGIIGVPYAIHQSGIVAGFFLFVLVAYLTDKTLRFLVDAASVLDNDTRLLNRNKGEGEQQQFLKIRTYEELISYPFGTTGKKVMQFVIFVGSYGTLIAYLIIIKDTVPLILGITCDAQDEEGCIERECLLLVTSLVIILPLSMRRDLASLSTISVVSVLADIVLVVIVAANAPIGDTVSAYKGGFRTLFVQHSFNLSGIFIGLGIISFAMGCHGATFVVYESLSERTPERFRIVTGMSVGTATVLSLTLGFSGYFGFLDDTRGDVLLNFKANGTMAQQTARILLCVSICLTYPMWSFVCRNVVLELPILREAGNEGYQHDTDQDTSLDEDGESAFTPTRDRTDGDDENPPHLSRTVSAANSSCLQLDTRQKVSILLYLSTLLPALLLDDLGPVLSTIGAVGGSIGAYIAPGMIYLAVHGESFLAYAHGLLVNYICKETRHFAVRIMDEDGDEETCEKSQIECPGPVNHVEMSPRGSMPTSNDGFEGGKISGNKSGSNESSSTENISRRRSPESPHFDGHVRKVGGKVDEGGDSTSLETLELSLEGTAGVVLRLANPEPKGSKPAWWFVLGFPMYCAIAKHGMMKIGDMRGDSRTHGSSKNATSCTSVSRRKTQYVAVSSDSRLHDEEKVPPVLDREHIVNDGKERATEEAHVPPHDLSSLPSPSTGDFYVAMFSIAFGVVSGLIGLGMNIYEQVKHI